MFYAHEGCRTDNAFTLDPNNQPVRVFRAFATKAERLVYRDKVWRGGENNLLDCERKMVVRYLGRQFVITAPQANESARCYSQSSNLLREQQEQLAQDWADYGQTHR